MRRPDRQTLRSIGVFLIILGALLILISLVGFGQVVHCPANGCSSTDLSQTYGPFWIIFYAGVSLVAIGIVLLIVARRMDRPQQ